VNAKFGHVNVIARDWRALAHFYEDVFGCKPVPPERDYHGRDLDAGTGLRGAHLTGVHLRLPGLGPEGPTLEIYSYDEPAGGGAPVINRPGFAHIAFAVDDVSRARKEVIDAGGGIVGEIVTLQTATGAKVTFCYLTDPEGNIIELQSWSKEKR
jgi:catechol 2,3-dioxygenase-like lactoylglutathione lyase family enzyme